MQDGKKERTGQAAGGAPLQKEREYVVALSEELAEGVRKYGAGETFSEQCASLLWRQLRTEEEERRGEQEAAALASVNLDCIHSPFRYAGGKYYARKLITEHIAPHTAYCEPFAGGASIFFNKPKVAVNLLNDKDALLMLTYRIIRDYPQDLIRFLKPYPALKELHHYFKNEFVPRNELEVAGRWYYLNRTSYSGIMNMPNCYWGYGAKFSMQPQNWPNAIRLASQKLQGVQLCNTDFEEIVEQAADGTFLFVDPPYFNADQDKFYTEAFQREDHLRLCDTLRRNSGRLKLFITYDNCDEVRKMYRWAAHFYDKEWNYCISRTDDQKNGTDQKGSRKKGKELFILNY